MDVSGSPMSKVNNWLLEGPVSWPSEAEVEVWLGFASVALVFWFFWSVRRK